MVDGCVGSGLNAECDGSEVLTVLQSVLLDIRSDVIVGINWFRRKKIILLEKLVAKFLHYGVFLLNLKYVFRKCSDEKSGGKSEQTERTRHYKNSWR